MYNIMCDHTRNLAGSGVRGAAPFASLAAMM